MAHLHQMTVQALQYYEKIGLFNPVYVDQENGYRYYEIHQSARLDAIRLLQSLGFSLKEIQEILEVDNEAFSIYEALEHRKIELKQLEIEVQRQKEIVASYMEAYKTYQKKKETKSIEILSMPERKILPQQYDANIYEMTNGAYEYQLRVFREQLYKIGVPSLYFSHVGSTITKENFLAKKYQSEHMFVFISMEDTYENEKILPAHKYVVIYCDSFHEELPALKTLHRYIEEHHLVIDGDYICEVVFEPPVLQTVKRNMFLRLQIPIQ